MSPDGKLLLTWAYDATVRLWDLEKLSALQTLSGLTDYVYAVAFSADGSLVAGGSYDGMVGVWSVKDGKPVKLWNATPGMVTKEPEPKKDEPKKEEPKKKEPKKK